MNQTRLILNRHNGELVEGVPKGVAIATLPAIVTINRDTEEFFCTTEKDVVNLIVSLNCGVFLGLAEIAQYVGDFFKPTGIQATAFQNKGRTVSTANFESVYL